MSFSMAIYVGVGSAAKNVTSIYCGVGSAAKSVSAVYVGVGGVAKQVWPDGGYNTMTDGYTIYEYRLSSETLTTIKSNATTASDFEDVIFYQSSVYYYTWLSSNSTYDTSQYNYIHFILGCYNRSFYLYFNITTSRTTAPERLTSEQTKFLYSKYPLSSSGDPSIPNTTWGVDISNLTVNANINFEIRNGSTGASAGRYRVHAILLSNESDSQTAYQNYLNSIGSSIETSFTSNGSQYITYGETIT